MNTEEAVEKYYGRLFFLPNTSKLVIFFLGLLTVVGFIDSDNILSIHAIIDSIEQYLIIGGAVLASFLPLALSKLFTGKRVLGLSTAIFVASLPAELIFYRLSGLRGTGMLAGSGFIYTILSAFYPPLLSLLISFTASFLAFFIANDILKTLPYVTLLGALLTEAISIISGSAFLYYFEVVGRRLGGLSPLWMARSFIKTWFTDNPSSLEEVFIRYGKRFNVRVKALMFKKSTGEKIALVFPSIHYGPFRNVGSSTFIYQLEKFTEPKIKVMTFHTAGSHEHNIATSIESLKVAKEIGYRLKEIAKIKEFSNNTVCEPYRVKALGGWESFVLNGTNFVAMFIVNKEIGNDDLPHELWDILEKKFGPSAITAAVDSHSFKGPKVDEINTLMPLINKVAEKYSCTGNGDVRVGFSTVAASRLCRGMCDRRVKVLTLSFPNKRRYGIIYIYGNNMEGNYRLKLEAISKKLGLADVEIVTPDDHSCAASFKEAPYDLVRDCEPLTHAVQEAILAAKRNESQVSCLATEFTIGNVRVAGERIFDFMKALSIMAPRIEKGSILFFVAINVLPVILYVFLFM